MADDKLKSIKASLLSRGVRVAGLVALTAKNFAESKLSGVKQDDADALINLLKKQVIPLVTQFGQMKGAAMKIGQSLSMYGEVFFPGEVNEIFKTLQTNSPPLDGKVIMRVLQEQLKERLNDLEVDLEPMASASIGQVHRAIRKSDGLEMVLKIQYPNVDQAIESDLVILKRILQLIQLAPQVSHMDLVFDEIKTMLYQEIDYQKEAALCREYSKRLKNDSSYIVPEVLSEYSTYKVLAMKREDGLRIDDPKVLALSQSLRNHLAEMYLRLYYQELFEWGLVQTDPHLGNYRVRLGEAGEKPRLILYDFGAVRRFDATFIENYKKLVRSAISMDKAGLEQASYKLGFLATDDTVELKDSFYEFCFDMVEPFNKSRNSTWFEESGDYRFAESDLPKRLSLQIAKVIKSFRVKQPPKEVVFLDRKTGGVFVFLAVIKAKFNGRPILDSFLK